MPGIVCIQEPSESLLGKSFHVLLSHPFLTSQWLWASLGHWEDNICLKPQQMIRCLLAGSPSLRARSASCLLWTSEDSPLPFPWSKWLYAPDVSIMVHQGTNARNPIESKRNMSAPSQSGRNLGWQVIAWGPRTAPGTMISAQVLVRGGTKLPAAPNVRQG